MTYRGLPADYDAWKTRSDRDDGPDDEQASLEFEPEPEEEPDMDEMAKEIENALNKDVAMPKATGLNIKPNGGKGPVPTCSDDIDRLIERLHSTIRGLEMLKGTL